MGTLDEDLQEDSFARIMVYGPAKSRKTWWAGRAAELGFNVTLFDMELGFRILKNLSPEAQRRVNRLDMRAPDGDYKNTGVHVLAKAVQGGQVMFDPEERRYVSINKIEADKEYYIFDMSKFTSRDVLVFDSWTAMVQILAAELLNILDASAIRKLEWEDYAKVRLVLDHFFSGMNKLPCHIVGIGHAETYAKRKPDADPKGKPNETIESIRVQPSSISRAHAETMAKAFSDVLFFEVPNSLLGTMISTQGSVDFDAGSRNLPPKKYKFDDLSFAEFVPPAHVEAVKNNDRYQPSGLVKVSGADIIATRAENKAASSSISVGSKPTILNLKKGSTK